MKKVFIKPEMKSHILRTNKMILGSNNCYYVYNCPEDKKGKCIAYCEGDYDCALDRDD